MIATTIAETKNHLSELLERVKAGETLIILDRKMPVARVERIANISSSVLAEPALELWNPKKILELPILPGLEGAPSLVEAVNEERSESW